jgi:hypothetical protein
MILLKCIWSATHFIRANPKIHSSVRFALRPQLVVATLYLNQKRWSVDMSQDYRRGFSAAEKTELWDRWQRGESLKLQ